MTGLTFYASQQLLRKVRAELAAEGVPCGCGKPMDHNLGCTHRLGKKDNSIPRTAFGAAGRSMAPATRWKVVRLVREGWNIKTVCDRTGESEWRVTQVMNDVLASGVPVSPTCPACGQRRNHRGPCPLPVNCACGRRRNHRGPCRTEKVARLPAIPEEQRIYLWQRYNDGMSIRRMSEGSGMPFSTVQRAVKFWNDRRRTDPRPCACGRPFRHPGGCIKNTPAALDRRWIARIEEMVREGHPPSKIARDLDLAVATVQKHSLPLRMRLFDEGIACACGRPLHHNYWCSAKWDQYGMRRGFQPLPAAAHAAILKGLLSGAVVSDLAKETSVHEKQIWAIRREMSPEDQRRRRIAIRARMRAAGRKLDGRAVLKLIEAALPKGLERALRDDVAGELQLAVMEGRIEVEQIRSVVRSFVSRGLADWQNQYGPRSLDEKLSADGNRTLGDMIEDATSAHHLEEISIGEHEE
ncbi:hypothetical protein [Novosphingobium guangzhouense]|uniref:Uncharacterized protein n=1 Tax=Novosphingobium guangzhouense TaxID=1850347 RepID=A0A2K2FVE2_9SPHN|nr:hypothetical protein [Novosphingobium guangzhouense]PNU02769.1 hypothetical protein A8V01_25520 [Novosphingobium guangzhouense]